MNPFCRLIEAALGAFNQLWLWRGQHEVWGQQMSAGTFERWLYLRMHRMGRMGVQERSNFERLVKPGMTVLDIGGNLGLYTVLLSRLVGPAGKVVTFEPDPDLFAHLQKNCALNHCANVEPHNLAVGSRRDRLVLQKLIVNSGDNHLGDGRRQFLRRAVSADVVALDEFLPDIRPDLVKIDVQGWEFEVLKGMKGILERNPNAAIYLEFWPHGLQRAGTSPGEVVSWLRERNFQLYRSDDMQLLDDDGVSELVQGLDGLRHADVVAMQHPG